MDVNAIKDPSFLKELSIKELYLLSEDIRTFLIESLAKTGGHLASNLGVVELTVAMHKVFESPRDHFVFDVGHQSYVHKILTGRAHAFNTLRQTDGLSGFIKRNESIHDLFEAGHSSTSLAGAAGFLFAKPFNDSINHVIAMIGDGALTSGAALEALNFLGHYPEKNPIIILNDNEMSISQNVGHLAKMMTRIRMKRSYRKIKGTTKKLIPKFLRPITLRAERRIKGFITGTSYFEELGYHYYGPLDGHDYKQLIKAFETAKTLNKPTVIHVRTQKGKGYCFSEDDTQGTWHGVSPYEVTNGAFKKVNNSNSHSYSTIVSRYLEDYASKHKDFYVITPAMIGGSDLRRFQKHYPTQLIDVGIAEQTAITLASGLALKGVQVFVSIYSTFLQRAYDQLIHDVARHNVPVIIGVDRAGLVGGDGETHQGIYDIPLLAHIPQTVIAHPKDADECYGILNYAFAYNKGTFAIRYERVDANYDFNKGFLQEAIPPSWEVLSEGLVTVITFGSLVNTLLKKIQDEKLPITLINARYIKPLDYKILDEMNKNHPLITVEESVLNGGLGSMITHYLGQKNKLPNRVKTLGFDDTFIEQGDKKTMLKRYGLDANSVLTVAKEFMNET